MEIKPTEPFWGHGKPLREGRSQPSIRPSNAHDAAFTSSLIVDMLRTLSTAPSKGEASIANSMATIGAAFLPNSTNLPRLHGLRPICHGKKPGFDTSPASTGSSIRRRTSKPLRVATVISKILGLSRSTSTADSAFGSGNSIYFAFTSSTGCFRSSAVLPRRVCTVASGPKGPAYLEMIYRHQRAFLTFRDEEEAKHYGFITCLACQGPEDRCAHNAVFEVAQIRHHERTVLAVVRVLPPPSASLVSPRPALAAQVWPPPLYSEGAFMDTGAITSPSDTFNKCDNIC